MFRLACGFARDSDSLSRSCSSPSEHEGGVSSTKSLLRICCANTWKAEQITRHSCSHLPAWNSGSESLSIIQVWNVLKALWKSTCERNRYRLHIGNEW